MPLFTFCAVCDEVRLEVQNKATILGFYGMLPYVEIVVENPALPLAKVVFVLMSGRALPKGRYNVELTLKGPNGNVLLRHIGASPATPPIDAPVNVALACQPFPLAGVGIYHITVIVNGKEDFSSDLRIAQGPPPPTLS